MTRTPSTSCLFLGFALTKSRLQITSEVPGSSGKGWLEAGAPLPARGCFTHCGYNAHVSGEERCHHSKAWLCASILKNPPDSG